MKKLKLIPALLLALAMAVPSHAIINAKVFGGYTTVGMADINKVTKDMVPAGTPGIEIVDFASGWEVGAQAGISMLPFISVGPKVSFVMLNPSTLKFNGTEIMKSDASFIPVLLGVEAGLGLPAVPITFSAALHGGMAFAAMKSTVTNPFNGLKTDYVYNGSGFAAEAVVGAGWKMLPFTSLNLDLGYRYAKLDKLSVVSSTDLTYTDKELKDMDGKVLPADLSGLKVTLGLKLDF